MCHLCYDFILLIEVKGLKVCIRKHKFFEKMCGVPPEQPFPIETRECETPMISLLEFSTNLE